jgi:hypothetical protein
MRISRDDLQADVAKHFPRELDKHIAQIRLSEPEVELPGSLFALRVRVEATTFTGRSHVAGNARVEGRLEYVTAEHAFYLRAAKVTSLELQPASGPGLAARAFNHAGDDVIVRAIEELLQRHPIYRLDPTRPKDAKAIRHLRSARVEDGSLLLEVGM